jgi:ubiquinone/menaquinone biosynthesis C-methylase UbiE
VHTPMNPQTPLPVFRSKQQAREYYSSISRFYDLMSGGTEARFREEAIRRLEIRPGEKILEIGIGTGRGLRKAEESAGPAGRAVGVDISDGMLAMARKYLKNAGLMERTVLMGADGAALPIRAGVFDAAFLSFTLELFDAAEIPTVLGECRRVLKADGRLAVVCMALAPNPNWMSRLYAVMHSAFPVWVDCRPIDARADMEAAGFTVVHASCESMFSLPVDIILARK